MNKIIVEVGSTSTKIDKFDGENIETLEGKTIFFKNCLKINLNVLNTNVYIKFKTKNKKTVM